jgi:triosephosphate isomerase
MRKKIVVGNWKMNLNIQEGADLVKDVLNRCSINNRLEIVFASSFVHLFELSKLCSDSKNVFFASQDCSANEKGSFTGEVSALMIASCGAKYVILGHSERRENFNETNRLIKLKVNQVFNQNMEIIFCCGESLDQRKRGVHFELIKSQITESLFHLPKDKFSKVVIAYEPIWAIGTGVTASPEQAQEIHAFVREIIAIKFGTRIAQDISIIYGGSCNPSNSRDLFHQKDIDGGLIGGASLNADNFMKIMDSL